MTLLKCMQTELSRMREEVTEKEMFYVRFGGPNWDITISYFPSVVS